MHLYLKTPALSQCPKCKKPIKSHIVCSWCGYYKGIEVVDVLKKLTKKERKMREKEMKAQEAAEKKEGKEKPLTLEELSRK